MQPAFRVTSLFIQRHTPAAIADRLGQALADQAKLAMTNIRGPFVVSYILMLHWGDRNQETSAHLFT